MGSMVGSPGVNGSAVGVVTGCLVGSTVGIACGCFVGSIVGTLFGWCVGIIEGSPVCVGSGVGGVEGA